MKNHDLVIRRYQYYILVMYLSNDIEIVIRNDRIALNSGIYLYVGSARGGKRILSRIARHLDMDKKAKWHIDHLTTNRFCRIIGVFIIKSNDIDYESWLSNVFSKIFKYIPRFGSSDKPSDPSHLFMCINEIDICLDMVIKILEREGIDYIWIHNV